MLFSPSQTTSNADFTHTSSTDRTPRTVAGLSRLSDFGSLDTAARSLGADNDDDEQEDDATELDSLDDGLPAFREPATLSGRPQRRHGHGAQTDAAILPTHDGLGTFQPSSQSVQDQLWQYELNNPRRPQGGPHRRRSSLQRRLDTVDEMGSDHMDRDRWQRIDKWRMEQSRALLHEIEKETRRRKSNTSAGLRSERQSVKQDNLGSARDGPGSQGAQTNPQSPDTKDESDEETLWERITRTVIKELMGIDDSLLSVIFGESLPAENDELQESQTRENQTRLSTTEPSPLDKVDLFSDANATGQGDGSWQNRLLERIARELGILVHQLCEHPGAFSTYIRSSTNTSNEYAGIPVPPRSSSRPMQPPRSTSNNSFPHSSAQSPHFFPTLQQDASSHEALWGIEEEDDYPFNSSPRIPPGAVPNNAGGTSESALSKQEREYWERELDVNMVFQYLRSRFSKDKARPRLTPSARGRHPHTSSNNPQQDLSHRADVIRQNHPLVARAHARSQSQFQRQVPLRTNSFGNESSPASPIGHRHQHIRRSSSSCASQSSKVSTSTARTLGLAGSGSSRNYWDIGGSVGSGRHIAAGGGSLAGGLGSWGEV